MLLNSTCKITNTPHDYDSLVPVCCDNKINRKMCKEKVKKFLNGYFGFITIPPTTKWVIPTTVIAKQTACTTVISTVISMVSPPCSTRSVVTSSTQQTHLLSPSVEDKTLGALFGLSLLLLVVVTTGWVCTCWTMNKKRNEVKSTAQNR